MVSVGLGIPSHDVLSGVSVADHHAATLASDLNLADMAARAHADLSDSPADAHHNATHVHVQADFTTVRLDASTTVDAGVTTDVNIQANSNNDRLYIYDAHVAQNDVQVGLGARVAGDETVVAQIHSVILRTGQGSLEDHLSLVNGRASNHTIVYLVVEVD